MFMSIATGRNCLRRRPNVRASGFTCRPHPQIFDQDHHKFEEATAYSRCLGSNSRLSDPLTLDR
jgi:hypothetical protein